LYSPPLCAELIRGQTRPSYRMGSRGSFGGTKQPEREADHKPVLRAELLSGTFISRPLLVLPRRQISVSGTGRDVEGQADKQVPGDLVPNRPQRGV
jgi:hypothetical protein